MDIYSILPFILLAGVVTIGSFVFFMFIKNKEGTGFEFTSDNLYTFYLYFLTFVSGICLAFGVSFLMKTGLIVAFGPEIVSEEFQRPINQDCEQIVDVQLRIEESELRERQVALCEKELQDYIRQQQAKKNAFWQESFFIGLALALLGGISFLIHLLAIKKQEKNASAEIVYRLFFVFAILFFGVVGIVSASMGSYLGLSYFLTMGTKAPTETLTPPGELLAFALVFIPTWVGIILTFRKNLKREKFRSLVSDSTKISTNILTAVQQGVTSSSLSEVDATVAGLMRAEEEREHSVIELMPSYNYTSPAVLQALSTILFTEYAEGAPTKRFVAPSYHNVTMIEQQATARAKELFNAEYVTLQPLSPASALLAVFLAFLKPGDTILSLAPDHGGSIAYGAAHSIAGKLYSIVAYGVEQQTGKINMDQVRQLAQEHKPRLVLAGASLYPRNFEWYTFKDIAKEVGAIAVADISPISGLVAGQQLENPTQYFDAVVSATHNTLRGPYGACIATRSQHAEAIEAAVFPGLQSGIHDHLTAAKAVVYQEALQSSFKQYAAQVIENAKVLAEDLTRYGFSLQSGGTDNHQIVIDAMRSKNILGKTAMTALEGAGISVNMHLLPFDTQPLAGPSGISLGTAAITSRNMRTDEVRKLAQWINEVLSNPLDDKKKLQISEQVAQLCSQFPIAK